MKKSEYFFSPMAKYIVSILIISVIVLTCNYLIVQKSYYSNFITISQTKNLQLATEFERFYKTNDAILSTMSETPGLTQIIGSFSYINIHNTISSNINFSYVVNFLESATHSSDQIQSASLTLYDENTIIFNSGHIYDYNAKNDSMPPNSDFKTNSSFFVYPYHYDLDYNNVAIGLRKILYCDGVAIGALTINFNHETFNKLIFPSELDDQVILLINPNGQFLYGSSDSVLNWQNISDLDSHFQENVESVITSNRQSTFDVDLDGNTYTVFNQFLGDNNLYLLVGHLSDPLHRAIRSTTIKLSAITIGLFLVYAGYCIFCQSRVNKSLRIMSETLLNASNGLFRFSQITSDEKVVNDLRDDYNSMLSNLETISDNIADISFNVHQYATALNEDSTTNSNAVDQISDAILTISEDTMEQLDEIETLSTLTKSIGIKIEALYKVINDFDHHFAPHDHILNKEDLDRFFIEIKEEILYLNQRKEDISNHLRSLTNTSQKNAMVNQKIKFSIDMQRETLKSMSTSITNLYRTSLNLNNNLSKFIVKVTTDEKHPS